MRSDSQQSSRRPRRGSRRPRHGGSYDASRSSYSNKTPAKKSFWQKIVAFFTGGKKAAPAASNNRHASAEPSRSSRKPEVVEVTSPKLYVGNLSFDATESDLFELFNGVGHVNNAEIVSHKYTQKSKGFAFVTMQTVDEAKRAVEVLHDQDFMGRKLVVSGAKTGDSRDA